MVKKTTKISNYKKTVSGEQQAAINTEESIGGQNDSNNFLQPDTVCAIASSIEVRDPVWFVLIKSVTQNNIQDDYGHSVFKN